MAGERRSLFRKPGENGRRTKHNQVHHEEASMTSKRRPRSWARGRCKQGSDRSVSTTDIDASMDSLGIGNHTVEFRREDALSQRCNTYYASRHRGVERAEKKSVRWGTIDIHSHEIMLGDNPAVSSGPPICIAWNAHTSHQMAVDDYESQRSQRRDRHEMLLPRSLREDLLKGCGYSRSELRVATEEADRAKKQRMKSSHERALTERLGRLQRMLVGSPCTTIRSEFIVTT